MTDVTYTRQEVVTAAPDWALVRAAVTGKVRSTDYLPDINSHDTTDENRLRNAHRRLMATYFNATGRTLQALTGVAFGKWPEVKLPASIAYVEDDADGAGVPLINQSQMTVNEVMQTGRGGLLVDYPAVGVAASRRDQQAGEARATLLFYPAEKIINWRTMRRGAKTVLSMVVLAEIMEEWAGFERKEHQQFRVLMLGQLTTDNENAPIRYIVQLWRADEHGSWGIAEEYAPQNGAGQPWQYIPFTFIGAVSNDSQIAASPMYDLASLNLAHFRNSADHEEALHFAAQPQLVVTGVDEHWKAEMEKTGVYVGSRAVLALPMNGDAKIIQSQPVSALSEEMKAKVEGMAQLGARLVSPGEAAKTATQAAGDEKASHSVLSLVCDNVSDAYRKALTWAAEFEGHGGTADFTISTEFTGVHFDAQQVTTALALVQSGKLPESDFWTYLRSVGLIEATKTDEAVRDEVESQTAGLGLTLDDGDGAASTD